MRSKLFVPGSRSDLFAKAWASAADAVSFDLEDAVRPAGKDLARAAVLAFVATLPSGARAPASIVRINPLDSPHGRADLDAFAASGVAIVNLPKVESPDEVRAAVHVLDAAGSIAKLLVNIETPQGLRQAASIAVADPRVAGLQLGLADLFEPFGISRNDAANVHAARFAVRLAAAEAGVIALDGAFADVRDPDGFRAEAESARRLGFAGKSCIHPSQVAIANAVFAPSDDELAAARRIVAADREAAASGRGAYLVDGTMVDAPFVARAKRLLAEADRDAS